MTNNEAEKLLNEIHTNAKNDRRRLEEFCDDIKKIDDPIAKFEMTENLSRLVDGLTRSNAQLVELAKIKVKKEMVEAVSSASGLGKGEIDDVFGEIGEGFSNNIKVS